MPFCVGYHSNKLNKQHFKTNTGLLQYIARYFKSNTMTEIVKRVKSPTPKFFKKLRNIGLVLATVATTVVAAPVALPAVVIKIAGYLAVAGGIAGAVSQTAIESE